jgi:peptide/nickel transport system permease protein
MLAHLARKLVETAALLAVLSMALFVAVYAIGDPVELLIDPQASDAQRVAARQSLGLDQPMPQQYIAFVSKLLTGDLGISWYFNQPVGPFVLARFFATIELAVVAIAIAVVVGVPLGVVAGVSHDKLVGRAILSASILGFSLPNFFLAIVLILIFAVELQWLPSSGRGLDGQLLGVETALATADGWRHLLLPAVTLSLMSTALLLRVTSGGVRDAMRQDYVAFATVKGLSKPAILRRHVMRNVSIPLVTVIGLKLGGLLAGAVAVETVFDYPGIGRLIVQAVAYLDRPLLIGTVALIALVFIVTNMLVDLLYAALDPRVRTGA